MFFCIFLGDVVLKDLKLKSEALNALKLPVTVKAGFLGTITLKVIYGLRIIFLLDQIILLQNLGLV